MLEIILRIVNPEYKPELRRNPLRQISAFAYCEVDQCISRARHTHYQFAFYIQVVEIAHSFCECADFRPATDVNAVAATTRLRVVVINVITHEFVWDSVTRHNHFRCNRVMNRMPVIICDVICVPVVFAAAAIFRGFIVSNT